MTAKRPILVVAGVGNGSGQSPSRSLADTLSHNLYRQPNRNRSFDRVRHLLSLFSLATVFNLRKCRHAFAKAGYCVALIGRNNDALNKIVELIKDSGGDVSCGIHWHLNPGYLLIVFLHTGSALRDHNLRR